MAEATLDLGGSAAILLAATSVAVTLYFNRQLTCEEWFERNREWEREGGAALFGDPGPGRTKPEFTQGERERIMDGFRDLLESKPTGCRV